MSFARLDRQDEVRACLKRRSWANACEIATALGISEATARRDLKHLVTLGEAVEHPTPGPHSTQYEAIR